MRKFASLLLVLTLLSCSNKKDETKDKSKDKSKENTEQSSKKNITVAENSALEQYDISGENPQVLTLPNELLEVSGITFTDDDRLFAHGDEDADVYELDASTGKVVKRFSLGELFAIKGDFEDITFANGKFYLVESNGKIYEFSEGSNNSYVDYKTYKTSLSSKNDVEGLCFDSGTNSLLLACKGSAGKDYKKEKAVYSFSFSDMTFNETPRFLISAKDIKDNTDEGKFNPSGIARHHGGTFFIIASQGNTIVEIDKDGKILNQKDLPASVHKQAEGIAFKKDGTLFISNEGRNKTPNIVIYPVKK